MWESKSHETVPETDTRKRLICFDEFYSLHDCQFHFGQKVRFDWLEQRSIRFIKFEIAVKDSDGKWQRPVYNK